MFKLIDFLKTKTIVKLGVIYLRYMIGFAFVFASMVKIKGERFTSIPPDQPVGYFFEAMYQSGFYWNFLGWGQFIAGALLMSQRLSSLGALVFFPIMLNVFMVTHSIDFGSGTPVITTLMLLGTLFLMMWDYKKYLIFLQLDHKIKLDLTGTPDDKFMNDPIWIVTGILFILITLSFQFAAQKYFLGLLMLLLGTGIGAIVIKFWKDWSRKKNDSAT